MTRGRWWRDGLLSQSWLLPVGHLVQLAVGKNFRGVLHLCALRAPCQWVDSTRRDEIQFTALGRLDRTQFREFLSRLRCCRPERFRGARRRAEACHSLPTSSQTTSASFAGRWTAGPDGECVSLTTDWPWGWWAARFVSLAASKTAPRKQAKRGLSEPFTTSLAEGAASRFDTNPILLAAGQVAVLHYKQSSVRPAIIRSKDACPMLPASCQ